MNKHLFRLLFGALFLVAATVFTGCKEDDSKSATPTLSVSTESLVFTDATEKTQTVDIKANCEWKVVASDLSWATVEPMNGRGNGTLSVTVQELPAGTNLREGKISFTLIHAEFGNWGTAEQSIAVSQVAGSEVPTGEIAYANNFDKEAATQTYGSGNSWPYTDQFEGWKNESGYGIADVTYTTSGISVRNNSNSNNNYSDYAGSGVNNLLFSSNSNFTIEKIAVNSVNLRLTFGTERYAYGEDDNTFNHDEFKVQLSNDGTNWSAPLTYTFAMGVDPNGRWDLASSDFSLPDGTTSLYIRFRSTLSGAHRLDDVTLLEGAGGQAITFDYVEPEDPGMDTSDAIYFNDMDKYLADPARLFANIADLKQIQDSYSYLSERQRKAIEAFVSHFSDRGGRLTVDLNSENPRVKERFLKIWNILYPLYTAFRARLVSKGMAYEGMVYRGVAERFRKESARDILAAVWPNASRYVFTGLNALNECEKTVMRGMQKDSIAEFCWDYAGEMISDRYNRASFFMKENIREILKLQIKQISDMLSDRGITLSFTEKAMEYLGSKGYDISYGARPIKRLLQKELVNELATEIISGKISRDSAVEIDSDGEKLTFNNKK